jgi:hypothetical protein
VRDWEEEGERWASSCGVVVPDAAVLIVGRERRFGEGSGGDVWPFALGLDSFAFAFALIFFHCLAEGYVTN